MSAPPPPVDLEQVKKSFEEIEAQNTELDKAIEASNKELEAKNLELRLVLAEKNGLILKRAGISRQLELCQESGIYRAEVEAEKSGIYGSMSDLIEANVEATIEKKQEELMFDHFGAKKLDILNEQRQWKSQIQDAIYNGPLGQKLAHLKIKIEDLKKEPTFCKSLPEMKSDLKRLENHAKSLKDKGHKLEIESVRKTLIKSGLEEKMVKLNNQARMLDNRLVALKIRYEKSLQK